jgi:Domain of unknown function (DUF4157)
MNDHASREPSPPPGRDPTASSAPGVPGRAAGAGAPLPEAVRAAMERSFNADFAAVRIHEDAQVAAIGAHAYTRGADIHFAPGRYQPHDAAGLELLGHELAHVVQQAQGRVRPTMQAKGLPINDEGGLEREADELGGRAARGELIAGVRTVAASAPAAPVQGYFHSDDFRMTREEDTQAPFTAQAPRPTGNRSDGKLSLHRKVGPVELGDVSLLVADDVTMAIHDTEAEPKEFYATRRVVESSNVELEKVESSYRLDCETGNALYVGTNTLKMVKPVNARQRAPSNGGLAPKDDPGFVGLMRHICIEMTSELVGNGGQYSYDLVLTDGKTGETYTRPINPSGRDDDTVNRLGGTLSTQPSELDRGSVDTVLDRKDKLPDHAKPYGTLSGRGQLNQQAAAIGVNRGALPEVGEGYAIFSQKSGSSPGSDWSNMVRGKPSQRGSTWGYHFAGVVAKSRQGDDRITLENYNRGPEMQDALAPHLFGAFRQEVRALQKENPKATPDELVTLLISQSSTAYEMYTAGLAQAGEVDNLWFFRMYGTRAGQTFHDQQGSDGYVNPLTVRVRRPLEVQRTAKLRELDRTAGAWRVALESLSITHDGARQILGDLAADLANRCGDFRTLLEVAEDNDALMRAVIAIKQGFATFVERNVVAALHRAYAAIIDAEPTRSKPDLEQLVTQLNERLQPTMFGTLHDLFLSLSQGLPDQEQIEHQSLAGLRDLVRALPGRVFDDVSLGRVRTRTHG